jgi:uncharacterized membrane protein YphA (DoxX/SURF4 family)
MGLLLLRAAVAVLILFEAVSMLTGQDASTGMWLIGALDVIAGILLLIGFLTPIAAGFAGLDAAVGLVSLIPAPTLDALQSRFVAALLTALATAVLLLGPGAFSIDSRLFGLREIIIPRTTPASGDKSPRSV